MFIKFQPSSLLLEYETPPTNWPATAAPSDKGMNQTLKPMASLNNTIKGMEKRTTPETWNYHVNKEITWLT
ncbi:hypothetical protein [Pelotomaculum schinkii]|uniref:hypothetical protein n=1 Tax=Pelotomaculum schinkii TaxID=78350 RepID=UPI00167DA753|nr:hypothetical protein [Pelotomaculum schinkii]